MRSAPTTSLDLTDPAFVADPYPSLAAERARHEVAWDGERWLTFSHAAASAVLRSRSLGRVWTDRSPAEALEPFNLLHRHSVMESEPPAHTRLRRTVASAFNRGHVERLRPRVRAIADSLLADCGPSFDLVADYAEPLPVLVIAELLGVPASCAGQLRAWSRAIVGMYEPAPSPGAVSAAVSAADDFAAFVRSLLTSPGPGLVADLAATDLSEDEVVATVVLLLNAGHEASVNVLGNGLAAVLARDLPVPVGETTVEELLRFDSALQLFERTATSPVAVGEVVVEPGERVAALIGAANRDPAVFADPDRLDVGRDPNPHLAFGAGLHFCLGAPLARMELVESLSALGSAYPTLVLAAEPVSRGTFVLRGLTSLLVKGV